MCLIHVVVQVVPNTLYHWTGFSLPACSFFFSLTASQNTGTHSRAHDTHTLTCTQTHTHTQTNTHSHTHKQTHTHVHTTHTHTNKHTLTCTNTHTHRNPPLVAALLSTALEFHHAGNKIPVNVVKQLPAAFRTQQVFSSLCPCSMCMHGVCVCVCV